MQLTEEELPINPDDIPEGDLDALLKALKNPENSAAVQMGQMGLNVFRGALEEGATPMQAFYVTAAWYTGLMHSANRDESEEENDPPTT